MNAQYNRSSFQVKILGIPEQDGEEIKSVGSNQTTATLIDKLASVAGIDSFDSSMIDVAHRTPSRKVGAIPAIIIRFKFKHDRLVSYSQRKKLNKVKLKLSSHKIVLKKNSQGRIIS